MFESKDSIAEYIPRLRRYARALLRNDTLADDLVQDTLERAVSKFHLWRPGTDLRAWLFTLMHNIFINQLRASGQPPVSLEESGLEPAVASPQERGLEIRDLATALTLLPAEYREVVLLVGLEGLSYEEVARVTGVPLGTVMSRLSRGRERLRNLMAGAPAGPALRRVK